MKRTSLLMMALVVFAGCNDPYGSSSSTADSGSAPTPQQSKAEDLATSAPSSAQEPAAAPRPMPLSTELPADFRKDIPIYPDSRITGAIGKMVAFETTATVDAVKAFYKTELPKNAWEVEEKTLGGQSSLTALMITKNNRQWLISISRSPITRGTIITINSHGNEPPKLIGGATRDGIPFMLAKWRPSLAVMIVGLSASSYGTGGSQGRSSAHGSVAGQRWEVTTEDGRTGDFQFNDRTYDLADGKLFAIRLKGDQVAVNQLDIDVSGLNARVEDCQKFIHAHPQIAASLREE